MSPYLPDWMAYVLMGVLAVAYIVVMVTLVLTAASSLAALLITSSRGCGPEGADGAGDVERNG